MPKSIPERWLEYKPYGTVIKGTKILPFKVPLKGAVNNNLEPDKRFTTSMLLEAFPRLKCIIDLTNTDRYYDEKEFTKSDIKYEKIMVPGREVPPLDVVKKFFKTMDDFTSACGEDDIVGVHCTHGVNRTGYLICRYLLQQLGWKLTDCLRAFEEARGYPIEREIYITALKRSPREKIDTSKLVSSTFKMAGKTVMQWSLKQGRPSPYIIEPPGFAATRRRFAKDGPFSPPHFGYAGPPPGFRPRPSLPHIPPIPPLSGPLPLYGPRPFRYGPPPRPVMPPPPPRSRFPIPCFPPPCAARMASGTRLPHAPSARLPHAAAARLPPLPPPPPPPPPPPKSALKRTGVVKRSHKSVSRIRIEIVTSVRGASIRQNRRTSAILPKLLKEQDFTVDTFEENLLAVSGQPNRRLTKGKYVPLNAGRTAAPMANAIDEGEQRLLK